MGAIDCEGKRIQVEQKAVFSRLLWRSKYVLCTGIIKHVGANYVDILVTSEKPNIDLSECWEEWKMIKRCKVDKVMVI